MPETTSSFYKQLKSDIEEIVKKEDGPLYAAFDADGTLWSSDAGWDFFKYQIKNNFFGKSGAKTWDDFHAFDKTFGIEKSLFWFAQTLSGLTLAEVRSAAKDALNSGFGPIYFEEQKDLVKHLQDLGVHVFVVTASVKWAVEAGAEKIGIPNENVIGVRSKIANGLLTDEIDGVLTWREGKVKALMEATQNTAPIFCSGNTMSDYFMMKKSKGLSLAVHSAHTERVEYKSELELQSEALKLGWRQIKFKS